MGAWAGLRARPSCPAGLVVSGGRRSGLHLVALLRRGAEGGEARQPVTCSRGDPDRQRGTHGTGGGGWGAVTSAQAGTCPACLAPTSPGLDPPEPARTPVPPCSTRPGPDWPLQHRMVDFSLGLN